MGVGLGTHIQKPVGFQFCPVLLPAPSSHFPLHVCTVSQSTWCVDTVGRCVLQACARSFQLNRYMQWAYHTPPVAHSWLFLLNFCPVYRSIAAKPEARLDTGVLLFPPDPQLRFSFLLSRARVFHVLFQMKQPPSSGRAAHFSWSTPTWENCCTD